MKYKKKDLRNPNLALLRRIERQEEKRLDKNKEQNQIAPIFKINNDSIINPILAKPEQSKTKLWLFDRRRGR